MGFRRFLLTLLKKWLSVSINQEKIKQMKRSETPPAYMGHVKRITWMDGKWYDWMDEDADEQRRRLKVGK